MRSPRRRSRGNAVVIVLVLFVAFFAFLFYVRTQDLRRAAAEKDADGWYENAAGYAAALHAQAAAHQPVLVYFHTSWCGWCRRLDSDVFGTSSFVRRYPSLLKVKLDAEDGSANRRLTSDFGVRAFPTVFVIRPDGRREELPGYSPPDAYFERLDAAMR